MEHSDSVPLFSIVIPTYNRLSLLKEALASAQAQTYPNLEIVLLDNHSDDGTFEYIKACAVNDNRLRIVRNSENIGPIANFQQIPEHAKGEYLLILSDDDLIEPILCARSVECMALDNDIVLYASKTDHFIGNGSYATAEKIQHNKQNQDLIVSGEDYFKKWCENKLFICWSGIVYRMNIVKQIGKWEHCYNVDVQSVICCALFGRVFIDHQVLSHYRLSNVNTSNTCWKSLKYRLEDFLIAYRSICRFSHDRLDKAFCDYFVLLIFCHIRSVKELKEVRDILLQLKKDYASGLYLAYVSAKHFHRLILSIFFSMKQRAYIRKGYILCKNIILTSNITINK
jgi:glycosyltransferase involved in cell wall biosynthesis